MSERIIKNGRVFEMTGPAAMLLAALLLALACSGVAVAEETASPQSAEKSLKQTEDALELTRTKRRQIQNGLNRLGFEAGSADGIFGGNSRWAIRQWQSANGHQATGYLTRSEADVLIEEGKELAMTSLTAGQTFRDCDICPQMVVVPGGSFTMGSPASEEGRLDREGPQHRVSIEKFAVGKYEVTFNEWDACVKDGGCGGYRPGDEGWGRGNRPVINVSFKNATSYLRWLFRKTGQKYRLLSESEWEYVARAGTTGPYHAGSTISSIYEANFEASATEPVGSFPPNGFGVHDMHGNVWEWVEDCWHKSYAGAPNDGSAWTTGGDCADRVRRGGSWSSGPGFLRSANRSRVVSGGRDNNFGFRVARTLTP